MDLQDGDIFHSDITADDAVAARIQAISSPDTDIVSMEYSRPQTD